MSISLENVGAVKVSYTVRGALYFLMGDVVCWRGEVRIVHEVDEFVDGTMFL